MAPFLNAIPDFNFVGGVPGILDKKFVNLIHKWKRFQDQDLVNLPDHFLFGARPRFPDYVVAFVEGARENLPDLFKTQWIAKRRFSRYNQSALWNPISTLIGLVALEGLIQIFLVPVEHRTSVPLLASLLERCPYWKNGMGVNVVQPAARLAIESFTGVLPAHWIEQIVHQLRIYIPGIPLQYLGFYVICF